MPQYVVFHSFPTISWIQSYRISCSRSPRPMPSQFFTTRINILKAYNVVPSPKVLVCILGVIKGVPKWCSLAALETQGKYANENTGREPDSRLFRSLHHRHRLLAPARKHIHFRLSLRRAALPMCISGDASSYNVIGGVPRFVKDDFEL